MGLEPILIIITFVPGTRASDGSAQAVLAALQQFAQGLAQAQTKPAVPAA